jgi:hypothetical protein
LGTLASVNYDFPNLVPGALTITYAVLPLFDQSHANEAGSTIPFRISLADANGRNVSSPGTAVQVLGYASALTADVLLPAESPGDSNPGSRFNYREGRYQYNLKTPKGLHRGTYLLYFTIDGDPLVHSLAFLVK